MVIGNKSPGVLLNWRAFFICNEYYKTFLKLHNGARIFDLLIYGENVGGGLHILNLEEIEKYMQNGFLKPQFIPVAHLLDGCYLLIDKTKISTDPNYLWFHGFVEYEPMQLNFEIFLDRVYFISGIKFLGMEYLYC
ncbi:SMI1/KNR4 family protein [Bacillus velezensis]|uniref:SMI1/KNR4 family protein n=1 Tax=Bacillus velezensis TaxID=492670 RepID=UPI001CB7731E|nr:SMI1/KNR4 family protein [Bacillus velezensis]